MDCPINSYCKLIITPNVPEQSFAIIIGVTIILVVLFLCIAWVMTHGR